MKRVLAFTVVLVMGLSVFAACGNSSGNDTPSTTTPSTTTTNNNNTSNETPANNEGGVSAGRELAEKYGLPITPLSDMPPIEFSVFVRNPDNPPSPDNPIINIIETITNTKIVFEHLVGDLEQKLGVMIASGDLNDAVFASGETYRFLDGGAYIPIDGLIEEHAPNLRRHYEPWWNLMKHTDGHVYVAEIYGTPYGTEPIMESWASAFWLQKDVLDHFGRAPKDLDEYFDFIREYKELNPTIDGIPTIGYEILTHEWRRFCIDNPPMFMAGYPNWGGGIVDETTNTASDRWSQPWTKPYYKKLNEEFHLGTIEAETLTRTHDQYLATIASGAVLGLFDQKWNFNAGTDPLRAEGKDNRTYMPLEFTYPGATARYTEARVFTGDNGLGITPSCSDPVRLLQYMDYLINEDVQRFLEWGIEGEHWFYNSDGRIERPEEQRVLQQDNRWRVDNLGVRLRDLMPKIEGEFPDGNAVGPLFQPEEYFAGLREYDRNLFTKLGIMTEAGFLSDPVMTPVYFPLWSMNLEQGSPAQIADRRVEDVNTRYLSSLVIAPADQFDALWDEYQAELDGTGRESIYEEFNRQIQERINAAYN